MEKEMIFQIMLVLWSIFMLVCIIVLIINIKQFIDFTNREKQDKVWSWFIEDASKFIYKGWCEYKNGKFAHEWSYGHYKIIVWLSLMDGKDAATSSVFTDGYEFDGKKITTAGESVLCRFNMKRSKQLASILLNNLEEKNIPIYGNR